MAQGASSSGILAGGYGGLGASISPTTAGNVLFTADGSVWSSTQKIVRGTSVTLTTQTSVDFTGIPSWAKRATVIFQGVSGSGTSNFLIQIGSGSVTTTGYVSAVSQGNGGLAATSGFPVTYTSAAAYTRSGHAILTLLTGNTWVQSGVLAELSSTVVVAISGGSIALGGALDRVRLTTVNGTDTFDAGSVNILYE